MDSSPSTGGDQQWMRVRLTTTPERVEVATDVFWSTGTQGIEEQALGDSTVLLAGFDRVEAAGAAASRLRELGFEDVGVSTIDDHGRDGWRPYAQAVSAGPFWLVPDWVSPPEGLEPGQILWLDPEATFGSGSHPTTRLVIEAMEGIVRPGDRMIDVGCGSGVLGIAAARLGARSAVGIDIDPACEPVLTANAIRNQVDRRVRWDDATIAELAASGARAELVAANLLAPVIVEHGGALAALVAPGGTLVLSGLLADRWEEATTTLGTLEATRVVEAEGWVAVVLTHPTEPTDPDDPVHPSQ